MPSPRWYLSATRTRARFFRKLLSSTMLGVCLFLICISCQASTELSIPQEEAPPVISEEVSTVFHLSPQLAVNSTRLETYLKDLSFERYEERDRQKARDYIEQELRANGWQIQEQAFPNGINVIASKGEQDKPIILVGAHYDTVPGTPGADDNASGVAATLEMSHLFSPEDFQEHQLKLAFFDQEEQGAVGSSAFTNDPEAMENLKGVIILEMMGYACYSVDCQQVPSELNVELPSPVGDFVGAIVDLEHVPLLDAFRAQEHPVELLSLEVPFKGLLSPLLLRSDHAPFWLKGTGAVMVSDTGFLRNPNYHRSSDTAASLDLDFFTQATELTAQSIASLLHTNISFES